METIPFFSSFFCNKVFVENDFVVRYDYCCVGFSQIVSWLSLGHSNTLNLNYRLGLSISSGQEFQLPFVWENILYKCLIKSVSLFFPSVPMEKREKKLRVTDPLSTEKAWEWTKSSFCSKRETKKGLKSDSF